MAERTGARSAGGAPIVFLSYSRADKAQAVRLARALQGAGLDVWWDTLIEGGAEFAKTIEAAISDRGFDEGWIVPEMPTRKTGKRVAVVGSGPAGMAAAQQLCRAGHEVHLFEKNAKAGGLLRYGIPDFKMEKPLIDRRDLTGVITFDTSSHLTTTFGAHPVEAEQALKSVVPGGGTNITDALHLACMLVTEPLMKVTSTRRCTCGGILPTANMRLESPWKPSLITVMSTLTTSPCLSRRSPGMPWQTTWLTEVQIDFG